MGAQEAESCSLQPPSLSSMAAGQAADNTAEIFNAAADVVS